MFNEPHYPQTEPLYPLIDLSKLHVIYDCDAAIDDAIALMYLSRQPTVEIHFISVVGTGLSDAKIGANNMMRMARACDIPFAFIGYGDDKPVSEEAHLFPSSCQRANHLLDEKLVPLVLDEEPTHDVVYWLKWILFQREVKMTIIATGPLTNIARLITEYPEAKSYIEKIVIMGGAIRVSGNVKEEERAEWNFYADPKAAEIVFSSGIAIVLIPLDATNQIPFTSSFYYQLKYAASPRLKLMYSLLKDVYEEVGNERFFENLYLWDGLAAMLTVHPNRADAEYLPIAIEPHTGVTYISPKPTRRIRVITRIHHPSDVLQQFVNEAK